METLRIHYLQHVQFEDLGCIEDWAKLKGHSISSTKFYENGLLPEIFDFDWLIVMGGPMGVYDDDKFNWLSGEKTFISQAIQAGKKVLGICLGAQLIASALGASVYSNPEKEIGWFPVRLSPEVLSADFLGNHSDEFPVFHWHGDTFDLPEGATRIASSEACINQAFVFGQKVVGLQFHFEVTEKSLERMIAFCGDELVPGRCIQPASEILAGKHLISEINDNMFFLLNTLEQI